MNWTRRIRRILALMAGLLILGAPLTSYLLATQATDRVVVPHGAAHWIRRTHFTLPSTVGNTSLQPFTWLVTYYHDVPGHAFCESTQFSVSISGKILDSYGRDPVQWAACIAGDTGRAGRGA